ncbi:MAG: penicillin-binding protein 2 [Vulcanimicrobiota bacterium]
MSESALARRMLFLRAVLLLSLLVLVGRLIYMQVLKGDYYRKKSEDNMIRCLPVTADRGLILDRTGIIMAKNNPRFTVSLLSFELRNPAAAISELVKKLNLKPAEVQELYKKVQMNTFEPIKIRHAVDFCGLSKLAEIQGDYPGIYIESYPLREYPQKKSAGHMLGYTGEINAEELEELSQKGYQIGDVIGKDGLERKFDYALKGIKGERQVLVNVEGRMARFIGETPARTGSAVVLNIDSELQHIAESALASTVKAVTRKNGDPSGGAVVALSPRTGEIYAMASYPDYDPNLFAKGISEKDYLRLIRDPACPLLNRTIQCSYPCASTFKMITGSSALNEGIINRGSQFYCGGVYDVGGMPFNCFVRSGHGSISFIDAIAHSCDVVFYMLATKLKLDRFLDYAHQFGIGSVTGIDLPGETEGLLPTPLWKKKNLKEEWYLGDTVNMSIGQGFLGVTPLQLAVATAAVANGGTLYRPHLVKRIVTASGKVEGEFSPFVIRKISIAPEHFQAIRDGMRGAVQYGTGAAAHSSVVEIAGKTGTAENYPTVDNPHGRNHTWFTSFAPYRNPEIVVTVFIEKSGGFGGEWGAPIARRVIEAYYGVNIDREKTDDRKKNDRPLHH